MFGLAALLTLGWATGGAAQPAAPERLSNWELNLHAAALRPDLFDESGEALQFGGRVVRNFANGLSFGGNLDWAKTEDVALAPFAGLSASLLLYSAEIDYGFQVSPRTVFFVGGGVGAATLAIEDAPAGVAESSTGLLVPLGGGIKIHGRADAPSWALRFEARDNVILLETLKDLGEDVETEPRNNFEVSAGFSFLFGGGPGPEGAVAIRPGPGADVELPSLAIADADRDGVPNARDRCLNRPGAEVDARGCPLDHDEDGVPSERDECPGTLPGAPVDERGCPTEPETPGEERPVAVQVEPPAPEPARVGPRAPLDEDSDGVPDERDACRGTPAGIRVNDRGCYGPWVAAPPAKPEPVGPVAPVEPQAPPEAGPQPPRPEPATGTACLDNREWFTGKQGIGFDGRRFEPLGFPRPVDPRFLTRVGEFDGVPIFVSSTAERPYSDLWLPRCGNESLYELYVETGSLP